RGRDHVIGAAVAHLEGGEKGNARLIHLAVGTPVPGQAASRTVIDALIGLVLAVEEMLAELRHTLQVFEGWHGPQTGRVQIAATELHWQVIVLGKGIGRIVAGTASNLA